MRILRAIRFAACLDFDIDNKTKTYIKKYGYLLKKLSDSRKKEELDKIFAAKNKEKGIKLITELGIDKYLGLDNLDKIVLCNDIIGIWSQIDSNENYPFSKAEKDNIKKIKEMLNEGINSFTIYKYGLYIASVAASILNVSYKKVNNIYCNLAIYSKKDIKINGLEIAKILNKEPDKYLKDIMSDIEEKIVLGNLSNEKEALSKYVQDNYGG